MAELRREPGFKIGIIGAGRVGHLLAKFLLKYSDVYADELHLVGVRDSVISKITATSLSLSLVESAS